MRKLLALATALLVTAPIAANSATLRYQLFDHPDGGLTSSVIKYGLRTDNSGDFDRTYSVEKSGANAILTWDDMAMTASIAGRIWGNATEMLYDLSYDITGLSAVGGGLVGFNASGGSGSLSDGTTTFSFTGKQKAGTNIASTFANDNHRLGSHGFSDSFVFRGWLMLANPSNDFLVRAELLPPPAPPQIPLPAALPLLASGLALFGLLRVRSRAGA